MQGLTGSRNEGGFVQALVTQQSGTATQGLKGDAEGSGVPSSAAAAWRAATSRTPARLNLSGAGVDVLSLVRCHPCRYRDGTSAPPKGIEPMPKAGGSGC